MMMINKSQVISYNIIALSLNIYLHNKVIKLLYNHADDDNNDDV